jgi:predicted HTH transcriptional regulator
MTAKNKQRQPQPQPQPQPQKQLQKQIPCGNDNKKSNCNYKSNSRTCTGTKQQRKESAGMQDTTTTKHSNGMAKVLVFPRNSARYANAREIIYALIAESSDGMTSREIAQRTGWALHTFGGRLAELKAAGKIRSTGRKRYGAEVWIAWRAFPMQWLMEAA